MPKTKKNRLNVFTTDINERSILIVLAIILLASVAVLLVKDKKPGVELLEPITVEQSADQPTEAP